MRNYKPKLQHKEMIKYLEGEYSFLAPEYEVEFVYNGETYKSVKDAFTKTSKSADDILTMGKILVARFDWKDCAEDRNKLLSLKDPYIIYGNKEHHNFWGACSCFNCFDQNQNVYGRLLMEVRNYLHHEDILARLAKTDAHIHRTYNPIYF